MILLTALAAALLYWSARAYLFLQWPILLGLSLIVGVFDMVRMETPDGKSFTIGSAVKLVVILLGGPGLAVWVAALGQIGSALIRRTGAYRTAFNTAQMVITVAAASEVFQLLGGSPHLVNQGFLAAVGAALVYFLVNSWLMAILFASLQGESPLAIFVGMAKQGAEIYLVTQVIGLIATFLVVEGGTIWSVCLVVLLVMLQRVISTYFRTLRQNLEDTRHQAVQDSLLNALVAALDARDMYTSGHSSRVAQYVGLIATEMKVSDADRYELNYASLLHDVGKLSIPDSVLHREGPLSPTERALMMEHPIRGIEILGRMPNVPARVLLGVRHHHEWFNGDGYPDGLKGQEIPLWARIIAVADAFDAMSSPRPYRNALPWTEAVSRLRQGRGIQFDPDVTDALLAALAMNPALELEIRQQQGPLAAGIERQMKLERASIAEENRPGRILPVHSKEIEIVYRLAQERRSLLDLSQTLHRVLEILYDTVGANLYYVLLLDDETKQLTVRAVAGSSADLTGIAWAADAPPWAEVLNQKHPSTTPDVTAGLGTPTADPETRSLITAPLLTENRVIGALRVESHLLRAFGQEEIYLLAAVARQLADAIEVARAHELMAYAASHDGLTGAFNRLSFYHRLEEEIERARESGGSVSVVVIDIDNFKLINDTYGHLVGDRTMKGFGRMLSQRLQPTDTVARYGGDEFAVIMPGTEREDASSRIGSIVCGSGMVCDDTLAVPAPTAAWGVATFPLDGVIAEELVAAADQRMYERKRNPERNTQAG